jgi:hypothetical protein
MKGLPGLPELVMTMPSSVVLPVGSVIMQLLFHCLQVKTWSESLGWATAEPRPPSPPRDIVFKANWLLLARLPPFGSSIAISGCVVARAGCVGDKLLGRCCRWCSCPEAILPCSMAWVASLGCPVVNMVGSMSLKGRFCGCFDGGRHSACDFFGKVVSPLPVPALAASMVGEALSDTG